MKTFLFIAQVGIILSCLTGCTTQAPPVNMNASWSAATGYIESSSGQSIAVWEPSPNTPDAPEKDISSPIDRPLERITLKPFWLKVSQTDSPVSPERFSGYHTGLDFEILELEGDTDVEVRALCTGPIVYKDWVSGYGGVAVQSCMLDGEEVTILYGHLDLASVKSGLESTIESGKHVGIIWDWYSTETDGERKHLHLAIHRWSALNLRWYTDAESWLDDWIDPKKYIN